MSLDQLAVARTLDGREVGEDVGEPSSGVMNPYPLLALNHFTVPVAMVLPLFSTLGTLAETLWQPATTDSSREI